MAKTIARPKRKNRPVQVPMRREEPKKTRNPIVYGLALAGLVALGAIAVVAILGGSGDGGGSVPGGSLPNTGDYHSLLVSPRDPKRLTLGTHEGLFTSADGGRTWSQTSLVGQDAMNLARPDGDTVWAAGHLMLARSDDGGASWEDVRPEGLPSLDVHGFAVDASNDEILWAAIAGEGLYRSTDDGASFALVNGDFGRGVMALASLPDGRLLAGDMERQGLFASDDGGKTWDDVVEGQIMGIAVGSADPKRILASGSAVLRSTDGGRSWDQVLSIPSGSGPIAWSASDPNVAYVVGFDRSLHRSDDAGRSWTPVVAGEVS